MFRWADDISKSDALAGLIYRQGLQSYLAGQLFVRSIELAEDAGAPGSVKLSATRREGDSFLAMPFEEALAFFRSKRVMSDAEFNDIRDKYKSGGFIARGLAVERLREVARESIEQLLAQDVSRGDVIRQIRDAELSLGIAPASSDYLDNVIRTNVASAYGAGRFAAVTSPEVMALRPYVQFRTAGDSRVRSSHASLNGLVFQNGSELAGRYAPPLFYRCRCGTVSLSQRQFEQRGLLLTTERVPDMEADEFWSSPPAPLSD